MPREISRPKAIPLPPPPAEDSAEQPAEELHAPVAEESAAQLPLPTEPPIEHREITITREAATATEEAGLAAVLAREAALAHKAALQSEELAAEEDLVEIATEETCEIAIWKGYAKARFYARVDEPGLDEEFAVAESPTFRFRGNGIPERTDAAEAAHATLIEKLVAKGWEPTGSAEPWYAEGFRRPIPAAHESS
jgi:hypothetical protein